MSFERVKYKLFNEDVSETSTNPLWLTNDPKNWDSSEKTLKRNKKTYGVYSELSKNLEFTKEAAEFLKQAYSFKDIEARVTLEEWRVHPNTEVFYLHSTGVFDFSDYKEDKLTVKIPFKTGGLDALIKAQIKEKFELERLESINGKVINALDKKDVALTGRNIFLLSKWETGVNEDAVRILSRDTEGVKRHREPIPMKIQSNSDSENIVEPIPLIFPDPSNTGSIKTTDGETREMFFLIADEDKDSIEITIDLSFKIDDLGTHNTSGINDKDFFVYLKRFNTAGTYTFVENVATLVSITDNFMTHQGETFTYSGVIITSILTDESLSLVFEMKGDYPAGLALMQATLTEIDCVVSLGEDSSFDNSQTKAVLFHEAGDKLMQIITGEQGRYHSEYFSDGDFSMLGVALGFWIRGFNDKKLEWSLADRLKTANVVCNTGYSIEIINDVETLVEEDMKYYFQESVAIVLPTQVSNVKREVAKDFYHSTLIFGYKKPNGDNLYEEAMGLDEYNTQNGFTVPITRVDTKYSKISNDRADNYGKEFARRKPQLDFPEEDTRYDKDRHLLDLKTGFGEALEERTWQDDYEIAPTGVFSPETATNLRLTPFRISERHQWIYGSGLVKHQTESVRFSNSVGNSELVTKKTGEVARAENGSLLISELELPRFVNQWITFDSKVDFFVNEQVYGKTEVNGRMIPNFYFKVQFINEYGQKEYGYLFELKPNKEGKWKLLKAS